MQKGELAALLHSTSPYQRFVAQDSHLIEDLHNSVEAEQSANFDGQSGRLCKEGLWREE
jgi:hypothetical protein